LEIIVDRMKREFGVERDALLQAQSAALQAIRVARRVGFIISGLSC